ncbi:DedA family protein [Kineosporia succinea]|uniref:Membrane protein DedA with SNARE-associated domain n=1 Tax=Kineosporia succinea TaxID=84632 RepID=A0ABT9P829_9ACTN|nr:VTT domain-containing protein [Kineosporia succinea]MDP9828846.1 membrane protein DedA with SNARE-associated domain [Kineosporia succinea]
MHGITAADVADAAEVSTSLGVAALAGLFLTVTLGAIVPVVPTGAAVSASAAYAWHNEPWVLLLVLAVGAGGAYAGDLGTYAVCRLGGRAMARRLRWLREDEHLGAVEERLQRNGVQTLLVSRLLPGGRIPVLLAAAFLGLDWRTFLVANAPACALWAVVYAAIGTVGGSIFPEPWQGVVAAVVIVLVVTQVVGLVNRRRSPA